LAPASVWTQWWREKLPAPAVTRVPDHPGRIQAHRLSSIQ